MEEKPKRAAEATPLSTHKDSKKFRIISTVRGLFSSGKKFTATEINRLTDSNDARKVISTLRAEGWNIVDFRLPDNRKLYWLATPINQLDLFMEGGEK